MQNNSEPDNDSRLELKAAPSEVAFFQFALPLFAPTLRLRCLFYRESREERVKKYTADYTFTGPNGRMMGAEERLQVMKNQAGTFVSASDITVRTYGSAGIATGIANTTNSSGATEPTRFIQVWIWEGGRWRLAASQVTRIE